MAHLSLRLLRHSLCSLAAAGVADWEELEEEMIRFPWKRRRRAHKSPPLRIVRQERDAALRELEMVKANLLAARQEVHELHQQLGAARARVAELENAFSVSVPAPMDFKAQQPTLRLVRPQRPAQRRPRTVHRTARVVPLHVALGGMNA